MPLQNEKKEDTSLRPAIEVVFDSIGLRFGSCGVLSNLSFEVPRGQFVALVGPTGCGKSSVLNLVAGLLKPSAGSLRAGGRVLDSVNRNAAYMLQQDALLPWKTVLENVMLGPVLRGTEKITPPQMRKAGLIGSGCAVSKPATRRSYPAVSESV